MVDSDEFRQTLRSGTRGSNKYLVVAIAVPKKGAAFVSSDVEGAGGGHNQGSTRVGFIVAKRFIPHAVDRNRIKRILRHHCRDALGQLPAGSTMVIRVLGSCLHLDGEQIRAAFDEAFGRAKKRSLATPSAMAS